jgi:quinoprotein glucose dehydrogenase
VAVEVLQPALAGILRDAPDGVRAAASRAVGRLNIVDAAPLLSGLVGDTKLSGRVRVEALKALAALDDTKLEDALQLAQSDANEELRRIATQLQSRVKTSNASARLAATLANGTPSDKQAALGALGALPDPSADEILGRWLDRLQAGDVANELQLDLLDAAAKRSAAAVKQKLSNYEASRPKDDPLAEYRETLHGGNAAEGKKIFFERPEASCVRCHKINGEGGEVGPDLSHAGAQKDRQYFLESIVLPNKDIAQGFESVLVSLKTGTSYAGVIKTENANELVINSPEDGLVTVKKSEIQSRDKGLSPMPEGMGQVLTKQDLRNLVEFLSGLK